MAMRNYKNRTSGIGIALALLLLSSSGAAQDEVEAIGPAVDTSAIETATIRSPHVPSDNAIVAESTPDADEAVDVGGITRRTTGRRVMDSSALGHTEITGNQELPTVMVIVPWKKADPGGLMGRPINSLLDEVLAPIDREVFIRQVDYYDDLYGEKQE